MSNRRFDGKIERLHRPERVARLEVERVIKLSLENIEAQKILDIGTGGGLFAKAFAEKGLSIAGVDVNPDMVAAAQEQLPDSEFKLAPAEQLPFSDGSFDLAFMGHVFHEVDDFVKSLQEAKRVSKKRVIILEWPYREEEHGPPLDHRLKHETIINYATLAGFSKIDHHLLQYMALYRLNHS